MAEKHIVDEIGDVEFVAEMFAVFGVRRATELFGYCILIGATGKELPTEIVAVLGNIGVSKSAVYRALADVKKFVRHLEQKHGRTMSMREVLAEIAEISSSPIGESVL